MKMTRTAHEVRQEQCPSDATPQLMKINTGSKCVCSHIYTYTQNAGLGYAFNTGDLNFEPRFISHKTLCQRQLIFNSGTSHVFEEAVNTVAFIMNSYGFCSL